ncbi:hypothetical protein TRVA0_042S00716 [Trichomonascus vanleenenianus]|uniref:uncharacterized protein n=1 Tax=Trichomonascus vanleenenianus TaxID=2268995 RepID=UPI003ECA26A4
MDSPVVVIERPEYQLDLTEETYDGVREFLLADVFDPTGPHQLSLTPLKGGITNVLLKGTLGDAQFLIRAYGKGTATIINRDREYATHVHLQSLGLAPKLYARFANGLIYGFIPGDSVHYTHLSNPEIMRGVAGRLAQWHAELNAASIEAHLLRLSPHQPFSRDLWTLLDKWIEVMPEGVVSAGREELRRELAWIRQAIGNAGGPTVVAHCDLLCGNIIVPKDRASELSGETCARPSPEDVEIKEEAGYTPSKLVSFIDYEYTMPAPRAFDIANHFMEWQGFDCVAELIPDPSPNNPVLRYWCYHYLSSVAYFKNTGVAPQADDIDQLISEIRAWWGMPGFYWGIWSAIQSSISEIDFDYSTYARQRLSEYFAWKRQHPRL